MPDIKQTKTKSYIKNKDKIPENKPKNLTTLIPILIIVLTMLIYLKSINNNFVVVWDDGMYIHQNEVIHKIGIDNIKTIFSSFYHGNYHPLTTLLFSAEYHFWKLKPAPYHFISLLLHIINVLLVYSFFRKLTSKNSIAAIISLLFAIHPMHVESVAWISEQKDLLYSIFYIGALIFYLKYISEKSNFKNICISFTLFILSCLSKSMAVTLPLVLFLLDYYKGRKFSTKLLIEKIPYLIISIFFGILTLKSQAMEDPLLDIQSQYSLTDRFFLLSYTFTQYIIKFIIPAGLTALHNYPVSDGAGLLPWYYYISPAIFIIIGIIIYKSKKYRKEIITGTGFFIVTLSVVLQIIPSGLAMYAERYTYIPYLGLLFIIITIGYDIFKTGATKAEKFIKPYLIPVLAIMALIFSVATIQRADAWKNGLTLFNDAVIKSPDYFYCYWLRGNEYIHSQPADLISAENDFTKSYELNPEYKAVLMERGLIRYTMRRYDEALKDFNEVIKARGDFAEAYTNRGMVKAEMKNNAEALSDFEMAIKLKPDLLQPYLNEGIVYYRIRNYAESIKSFDNAIKLKPDWGDLYDKRALSKYAAGDTSGACSDWQKALSMGVAAANYNINQYCR